MSFKMKLIGMGSVAGLSMLAGTANAQYDESRIRQWDQQTQVVGTNNSALFFTISGYSNDWINTPFYSGTLGRAPGVYEALKNSDGQTSYRFCVTAKSSWNGRIIELYRGTTLIDGDRVRIY